MVSGAFAGAAGILQAYYLRHISPTLYGAFPSLYLALMVMLGGARLMYGPLIGAIIVSFLPEVMNLNPVDSRIAYGVALLIVILCCPAASALGSSVSIGGWRLDCSSYLAKWARCHDNAKQRRKREALMAALEITGLRKAFGGVVALDGVDLSIPGDKITGVIGPNGSGKTTLFNVITGVFPPTSGRIEWLGEDITRMRSHQVARKGLIRTFQQAMSFPGLSVLENVRVAMERGDVGAPA